MKKSIALVAMTFGVTSVFAQDLTSKKGEPILPEAGDYMIGIDANPFLNYLGNFFGKAGNATGATSNQAPTFNFMNGNNMIVGKYFKDASTAYRVGIRIGIDSKTTKKELVDVTAAAATFPTLATMKEDKLKDNSTNIGFTVGIEKRKGKTRLQGFYGADFMIFGSSDKQKYTYGQNVDGSAAGLTAVTAVNTTNFGTNITTIAGSGATSGRVTSKRTGNGLGFGLRAFIGAEYFILPKISIGGEFGWGVGYMTGGKTKTVVQSVGGAPASVSSIEQTTKNGGHLVLDTDLNNTTTGSILAPSAALRLNLHF